MDLEALKLIGGGGLAMALLSLIYIVGMKMVAAIDKVGTKLDEHTKTDVEHHGEVKEAIVRVEAKLDERRANTRPRGVTMVRDGDT